MAKDAAIQGQSLLRECKQALLNPPPIPLSKELCTSFVAFQLLKGDAYPSELVRLLMSAYPLYRASDWMMAQACKDLYAAGLIYSYSGPPVNGGAGRPCMYYSVTELETTQVQFLSDLWLTYHERLASQMTKLVANDKIKIKRSGGRDRAGGDQKKALAS